jgi:hypothetical protein
MTRFGRVQLAHVGEVQCSGNAAFWYDELVALSSRGDVVRVPIELHDDPRLRRIFSPAVTRLHGGAMLDSGRTDFVFCGLAGAELEAVAQGKLRLVGDVEVRADGVRVPDYRVIAGDIRLSGSDCAPPGGA